MRSAATGRAAKACAISSERPGRRPPAGRSPTTRMPGRPSGSGWRKQVTAIGSVRPVDGNDSSSRRDVAGSELGLQLPDARCPGSLTWNGPVDQIEQGLGGENVQARGVGPHDAQARAVPQKAGRIALFEIFDGGCRLLAHPIGSPRGIQHRPRNGELAMLPPTVHRNLDGVRRSGPSRLIGLAILELSASLGIGCHRPDSAAVAQLVRASDCGSEGRWFETTQLYQINQQLS